MLHRMEDGCARSFLSHAKLQQFYHGYLEALFLEKCTSIHSAALVEQVEVNCQSKWLVKAL